MLLHHKSDVKTSHFHYRYSVAGLLGKHFNRKFWKKLNWLDNLCDFKGWCSCILILTCMVIILYMHWIAYDHPLHLLWSSEDCALTISILMLFVSMLSMLCNFVHTSFSACEYSLFFFFFTILTFMFIRNVMHNSYIMQMIIILLRLKLKNYISS